MASNISYIQGAELDSLGIEIEQGDGTLVDMTTGWTFSLKVGTSGATAFTKTSGITGTVSGMTVNWTVSGELNTLAPGAYIGEITATRTGDSRQYRRQFALTIDPALP
jgi:hypothetical protein